MMDPLKHAAAFVAGALASQYGVRADRPAHALSAAVHAAPPASSRGAVAAPPPSSSSSSSSAKTTTSSTLPTIPPLLCDYAQTAAAVAAAGALAAAAAAALSMAGSALASRLVFEAEVDSRDDAYRWLMLWLSSNSGGSGAASRASRVSVTTSLRAFGTSTDVAATIAEGRGDGDGGSSEDEEDDGKKTPTTTPFALLPAPGTHLTWHNSRPFIVSRRRSPGHSPSNARLLPETLTLRTPRRGGRAATLALLRDARRAYRRHSRGATAVHGVDASGMYWELAGTRPRRPLSSVVLPLEQDGARLLADCRRFLSSGAWYASRGIPHRRGYLLHGPPGTGKSSLVAALAAELGLDIHAVTLSSPALTDDGLRALLNAAGARACLLLEDVDAAACAASRGDEGAGGATANGGNSSSLTLSGLLNAIDGVAAQEGRLLFLTTNHPERLDPALVRPGRVDVRVPFARASRSQLRRLFSRFFFDDDGGEGGGSGNENDAALLLANRFAAALPEGELSMAAVQGFLLLHRDDPKGAVEAAERGEVAAQGGDGKR